MNGRVLLLAVAVALSLRHAAASAQQPAGSIRGSVLDSSNAVVPQAHVTIQGPSGSRSVVSGGDGSFTLSNLPSGSYTVTIEATGFSRSVRRVALRQGATATLRIALSVAPIEQVVEVTEDELTVSTDPEGNANALVLKGKDLDTLSDDPDEMLGELEALAGPAAGPNGAQLYIDGFTGGELPPKAAILEIRVNQNPFSAQYERLGYGRIDIITKPGTKNWHGLFGARGNDAAFNARNPLLQGEQPPYYSYDLNGDLSGPLWQSASFIVSGFSPRHQNTSVVNAILPASLSTSNPMGDAFSAAYNSLNSRLEITPRIDFQLGQKNVASLRYTFACSSAANQGIGELSLSPQAYSTESEDNELQLNDSTVVSAHLANDFHLQYRRIRASQNPVSRAPEVSVQGAFLSGGSSLGVSADHQDNLEIEDGVTWSAGSHTIRGGVHVRLYHDVNQSTALANGLYNFTSTANYIARTPHLYTVALIANPSVRLTQSDSALFLEDTWKQSSRFTLSYGLRWETQTKIADVSDWGPRLSFAWALDKRGAKSSKTVLRAGYGWFYQRFTVANAAPGASEVPYLVTALHQNGVNQQVVTVTDPTGYSESAPGVPNKPPTPSDQGTPTIYSVDPRFHAALDMQVAIGIDRQLTRTITGNVTYLNSRGVDQYFTNNTGAPYFATAANNTYPQMPLQPAAANLLQFQSGGVYREHQLIASVNVHRRVVSFSGFYTYTQARGNSNGVSYVPSIAQNPGLDYGRSDFDIHHRIVLEWSIALPKAILVAPMFVLNSGAPFNITTGTDLTGNNQFNARPTFGPAAACLANNANYVATPWGCLDADPIGTTEHIVPYGLGTGPRNVALNLRLSKSFGFGAPGGQPGPSGAGGAPPPPPGGGSLGPGGLSGGGPKGPPPTGVSASRRYSLTFSLVAHNLLNTQNLGQPNGVLSAPDSLRFRSQTLAGGPFNPPEGGNRSLFLETRFSF